MAQSVALEKLADDEEEAQHMSDCHSLTEEVLRLLRHKRCGAMFDSRLGDLQCLPSYLYTCVGNQIRQSQKEPFCTASGLSLVLAHCSLSIHSHPYDMVRPTSGPMRMCGVNESQV